MSDFSSSANPNGVWTYEDAGNIQGPLSPFIYNLSQNVTGSGVAFSVWGFNVPIRPSEIHNNTLGTEFDFVAVNHRTDELVLYPLGGFAAVDFKAPETGSYFATFNFRRANKAGSSPVYLRLPKTSAGVSSILFQVDITTNNLFASPYNTSCGLAGLNVSLLKDDRLTWVAGSAVGPTASDQIGLRAFVTKVPEPGTALMLAIGGATLAALRRRRHAAPPVDQPSSRASRRPLNCQRASAGKKLR